MPRKTETIVTITCDRCGAKCPERHAIRNASGQSVRTSLQAVIVADGNDEKGYGRAAIIEYQDLCDSCMAALTAFMVPFDGQPRLSEKREAREKLENILRWSNTDQADYLIVRIIKMIGGLTSGNPYAHPMNPSKEPQA